MSVIIHVNGPASIYFLDQGLGYSSEGVNITFTAKYHDIFTDRSGWGIPENVILLGEEATVSFELLVYEKSVLDYIVNRSAQAPTYNNLPNNSVGTLMQRSKWFNQPNDFWLPGRAGKLSIRSWTDCRGSQTDTGYYFWESYLADSYTKKLSTRATKIGMTFRCLPVRRNFRPTGWQADVMEGTLFTRE